MFLPLEIFVLAWCWLGLFYASAETSRDSSGSGNSLDPTKRTTVIINKTINIYNTCTGSGCRRTTGSRSGSGSATASTSANDSDEDSSEEMHSSELVRIGCYRDKGNRQLNLAHWTFPANSPAVCISACKQAGYKYAGPEATNHCFCGNEIPPEEILDINCNMKCNGAEVFCGGIWALEVFDTKLNQKDNFVRVGCFRDKGERQLGNTHWVFSRNSPAVCIAACKQKGYPYAGTEAGPWCFCGNLIPPEEIPDINCNTKCNGAELNCGGGWALDVYETGLPRTATRDVSSEEVSSSEIVRIGCYRDKGNRQLGSEHWTFPVNSPAVCVAACKQAGYKYAGPEATNHCFCGNEIPPEKIADSNCNMKCNGAEVFCGGIWALEIFDTKLKHKENFVHVGCFRDKGERQLGNTNWVLSRNSPAVCIAACKQKGYKYAGTEWCFCGNLIPPERIPDINCNTKCNGAELNCGGGWALDVYETGL